MSNLALRPRRPDVGWLTALAAECLKVPEEEIDPAVPLARYGLDSLAAAQLAAAVAEKLGRDVPDDLLLRHADLLSLARFMEGPAGPAPSPWDRMLADSVLPDDVRPPRADPAPAPARAVLLTGATGFLGAYLLRALLQKTSARVYCLVRPGGPGPGTRVRANLEAYGLWEPGFAERVCPVAGDLLRPGLGLSADRLARLARQVDEVYHAAACVNWVASYDGLREANVGGTLELLRLACRHRALPFHFVSSLTVCYPSPGPAHVSERDDMLPHLAGLHLGYAQTKCVAEALVRAAGGRGLPVTIHRPGLITGDSRSGASNPADLLTLLLRGCVRMGCAPDLDWPVDACPVDHVADAVVALARGRQELVRVSHLLGPRPRRWGEVVLWMNLFGYPVRLVPYRRWLARLREEATAPGHPLHLLRGFFLKPVAAEGLTLPEVHARPGRPHVDGARTRAALAGLSLECPALDSRLLDRCFAAFIARGDLPPVARPARAPAAPEALGPDVLGDLLRRFYRDGRLQVRRLTRLPAGPSQSLITEVTSWRHGTAAGLSRYRVEFSRGTGGSPEVREVVVKVKPEDRDVMEVGEAVAAACGPDLGAAFARHRDRLGLAGSHLRELALYEHPDERLRKHTPVVFGTIRDDGRRRWVVVLEDLAGLPLLDSADDVRGWRRPCVEAALRGIAEVHAVWYGREAALAAEPWLGAVPSAAGMEEMSDLWAALADHAAPRFCAWAGADLRRLQGDLLVGVGRWWGELEGMPRALIHNDFNPRNLALRESADGLRLCAYDWELATLGVPQHDLAELLCFVLTPEARREEVEHYLETHRRALAAAGRAPDARAWRRGFELSLCDLILNRLPLYSLAHTFVPQPFLERVVRTWRRLHHLFLV
jgi:thioester reductase-like protein